MRRPAVARYFAEDIFSSIRVRIPEGLGYNLTARLLSADFLRIAGYFNGSIGGDTLNGTIGSGGCNFNS